MARRARGALLLAVVGVLVSAGAEFLADQADAPALRISVARGSGAEIEKALEIVGALARGLARQATRRAPAAARTATGREDAEAALIQI